MVSATPRICPMSGGGTSLAANGVDFSPIRAFTRTAYRPADPVAFDWIKLAFVRDGSAILLSEFGKRPVRFGDAVLLSANVLCGIEPEGHITATVVYADADYVVDQVFWQHASVLRDRLDAAEFASTIYTEPAQILRLGEDRHAHAVAGRAGCVERREPTRGNLLPDASPMVQRRPCHRAVHQDLSGPHKLDTARYGMANLTSDSTVQSPSRRSAQGC